MAAATAGYDWNHSGSSPLRSSPDTTSPMYPERPIRPLPKRRLRARLSPEQREAIIYPPVAPSSSGPLFHFPYSPVESRMRPGPARVRGDSDHHACQCGNAHCSGGSSEEDELSEPKDLVSSPSYRNQPGRPAGVQYSKPASTSSSADGYDSFENTNNKKKRKIPNMGSAMPHHTNHLAAELASLGISHPHDTVLDEADGPGRYYASAPSTPQNAAGAGLAGAGRGRFGRSAPGRTERRALGTSASTGNAKALVGSGGGASSLGSKRPPDQHPPAGIISTAIANAHQPPPPHPKEHVSLLHHEAAKSPALPSGPFTFTGGSDKAKEMVWPGEQQPPAPQHGAYPQPPGAYPTGPTAPLPDQGAYGPGTAPRGAPPASQGSQTSPHLNTSAPPTRGGNMDAKAQQLPPQQQQQHQQQLPPPQQQQPAPRKPRRTREQIYELADRKRRLQQKYQNEHNPPNPAWICEFCEYETIFGTPPLALIRQYEIKDRKERKRLAEKRRLLEKARMKGRKGKKASKKAQQNANNAQHSQNPPPGGYDRHPDDGSLDGQPDDEFYGDDYDDLPPPQHHGTAVSSTRCDHSGCHHHHHHHKPPILHAPDEPPAGGTKGGGA